MTYVDFLVFTSNVKEIGKNAFKGSGIVYCHYMDGEDGVTEILPGTFTDCKRLQAINLPEGLQKIYEGAFSNCPLLSSAHLSNGPRRNINILFSNCEDIPSIFEQLRMKIANGKGKITLDNIKDALVRERNLFRKNANLSGKGGITIN